MWLATSDPPVNVGCIGNACVRFHSPYVPKSPNFPVIVPGNKAQVLVVPRNREAPLTIEPESIPDLSLALFSDERLKSDTTIRFSAASVAPDGSIWLGTDRPSLFRVAADYSAIERVCLPKGAKSGTVTAIEAHPDGRLIVGLAPVRLVYGNWVF